MAAGRAGSGDLPIDRDPSRIEEMFGHISARYDLMNRLMTAGLDGRWRRMAAAQAALSPGDAALDACCGTGDLTFSLTDACPDCDVVGLDFTSGMLDRAREKATARAGRGLPAPREFVAGDLLALHQRAPGVRTLHRHHGGGRVGKAVGALDRRGDLGPRALQQLLAFGGCRWRGLRRRQRQVGGHGVPDGVVVRVR